MRTWVIAVVFLVGCKSDSKPKEEAPPPKPAEGVKPAEGPKETAHDIAKEPRTPIAAKTLFLELNIDLPPSASTPMKGDEATTVTFKDSKLELAIREISVVPSQQKTKGPPKPNVDEKMTHALTEEPNGYLAVLRKDDATSFSVEYCKDLDPAKPPSGVCCTVSLRSETPIVDIDKLIAFGGDMCRTIKATNR